MRLYFHYGDKMPNHKEQNSDPFKGLPPQIVKALRHSGINSLEEAQKLSDAELAGVKNVGPAVARKIKEWKS
jgi:ERCC4-type nuclease